MKDIMYTELGEWLREKREEKGYSQQEVADRMNVTRTAVHCWEKGKRQLYATTLFALCEVLDADLNEFTRRK